jgi:hypothetical protein
MSLSNPPQPFKHHFFWYFVTAVKLTERHFITPRLQIAGEAATTPVDGQDLVTRSMRDVKAGLSLRRAVNDEPGRKGSHAREEISVYQTKREGVRRAIRESSDGNTRRVNCHGIEDPL